LRATTKGGGGEAEGGEVRGEEISDGGAEAAEGEGGGERRGAGGGVESWGLRVESRSRRRGQRRIGVSRKSGGDFLADLGEIGGGGEAGEANGLEALDLVTEGAGEFTVNIERAAAHAGDGTHFLDTLVGEFADDKGFAGAKGVAHDAGDFDGEGLGLGAAEDGPDFATLAGFEFVERERGGVDGLRGASGGGGKTDK
jgi:hypothetical protein